MGFLNILGKVAGAITGLGSVAGKQAEGDAKGLVSQAQLQQNQDQNALQRYQLQQNAQNQAAQTDLERQQFGTQNRAQTAKQALIGALLSGGIPQTKVGPGGASGGIFSALQGNPDALAAMKTLGSQGATAQATPLQFTGGQIIAAPTLTPLPKAGKGSNILSSIARIAQLVGAAAPLLNKNTYKANPNEVEPE